MNATELKIGNLVTAFGETRKVTGIFGLDKSDEEGLLSTMIPGCEFPESNLSFRPSYARPIPLTEEILKNNGWFSEDTSASHCPEDTELKLELSMYGFEIWWTINLNEYKILKFEYVHELQNALKLCSINKELVLDTKGGKR